MANEKWPQSNESRRLNILSWLDELIKQYPDFENDIEDLKFNIEEKQLWNWTPLQLRIEWSVLRIKRNEKEDDVLKKLEAFFKELLKDEVWETVEVVKDEASDLTKLALAEWKKRTYWRDITPVIVKVKYAFEWEKLFDDMSELREKIHDKTLWNEDFTIENSNLKLDIKSWDSDEVMLDKLTVFFKKLLDSNISKFEAIETIDTNSKDFNKERKKAWAVILSSFNIFRWKFKWEKLSFKISELRDLIDNRMLWISRWFKIDESWIKLHIKKWDNLDTVVEKILNFIEAIQKKYPDKFDKSEVIDSKEVLKSMDEDKTYWRDVIAWIDILQRDFPVWEYPVLEKLKQMIENNKVWAWTNLYFNIWGAILEIDTEDSEKSIKNKISVFIWILKQFAEEKKDDDKLNDIFWRDIEATLKSMEDIYWSNSDFQMLIMLIEAWVLWTVKDFNANIEGIIINIFPSDSDWDIKKKLIKFIDDLKNQKKVVIDNQEIINARKKIAELEKWMRELSDRYKKAIIDSSTKDSKIWTLERKVEIHQQEIKDLKNNQSSSGSWSWYSNYSRPVTRFW
jgi:hypothetical protein